MSEKVKDNLHFPVLDTLRAVGALAVFTTHAAFWSGTYTGHGVWGTLLARLDVGVAVFFVLSGFLLARPHLARAAAGRSSPSLGNYYWKRFLRIYPLYVVTVLVALGLIRSNSALGLRDWLVTLLLGNTFVDDTLPAGLTHMWSLAVEVSFYLVLPLLMLLVVGRTRGRRPRLRPGRVLALVLAMTAVTAWWELVGAPNAGGWTMGQPAQWLPAYLGWFATGIFLALVDLLHRRGTWARLTEPVVALGRQPGSCWIMVVGLLFMAATPIAGPSMLAASTAGQLLTKLVLYGTIGGLLVLTGVFAESRGGYSALMSHRWARHLGFISYGFFCLHLPVLHLTMWLTGWQLFQGRFLAIWLVALAGSLVAAELAHRLVETPSLRLRRLGRPRAARTTDATTGTSAR